ncbi:MAG: flagellar hook assembly protein FlgD [Syntrophales bacterium]|nr:flagellar hook assembly protein FlgD [Syntrophales bacterium]
MGDVNGISKILEVYGKSNTTTATKTTSKSMGKDDFLKMLVAQLKYQDPLNPMDGTEFAAQLAQFSSLEQLCNLSEGINNLGVLQLNQANMQAVQLIGKEITASGGNSFEALGQPVELSYELSGDAATLEVLIYGSSGELLDRIQSGMQKAGLNTLTWSNRGGYKGRCTFQVVATSSDGKSVDAEPLITGKVSAVSFRNQSVFLKVDGKEVAFTDVKQIKVI